MRWYFGVIISLTLSSCTEPKVIMKNLNIQGHRGCRGLLPENTIEAFIKAIDLGVTTLELDVVISKDSQVVVSHEPFFNYQISTHPEGKDINKDNQTSFNIFKMDYEEIKRYDVGTKEYPKFPIQSKIKAYKPTLEAVIDTVQKYLRSNNLPQVNYNIEIKYSKNEENIYHPTADIFIKLVYDLIISKGIKKNCNVQCFDEKPLNILHRLDSEIATAFLVDKTGYIASKLSKLNFKPTIYSPHFKLVDNELVKYCHENSIKIIPWTVNDEADINKIISMGVDGIITDYPDKVIEIYEGIRPQK